MYTKIPDVHITLAVYVMPDKICAYVPQMVIKNYVPPTLERFPPTGLSVVQFPLVVTDHFINSA